MRTSIPLYALQDALIKAAKTDQEVYNDVINTIAAYNKGYATEKKKYLPKHDVYDDLAFDRLDVLDVVDHLKDKYPAIDLKDPTLDEATTIQDLINFVQLNKEKGGIAQAEPRQVVLPPKDTTPHVYPKAVTGKTDPRVYKDVMKAIADYDKYLGNTRDKYLPTNTFDEDLGWPYGNLDKLDALWDLQKKYPTLDPSDPDFDNAQTIQDLVNWVQKYKGQK